VTKRAQYEEQRSSKAKTTQLGCLNLPETWQIEVKEKSTPYKLLRHGCLLPEWLFVAGAASV